MLQTTKVKNLPVTKNSGYSSTFGFFFFYLLLSSMWSGNEEVNDEGQPVRLYQPIQYGGSNLRPDDPTASFIGGPVSDQRVCPSCGANLVTLVQLHVSKTERTLRVQACNSTSCFRSLFESTSKFHFGGNGIVVCERLEAKDTKSNVNDKVMKDATPRPKSAPVDDWGVSGDDDVGLDDLEAKLSAMETSGPKASAPKPTSTTTQSTAAPESPKSQTVGLPIMPLHSIQEPAARTVSDDPRDVGLHGTSKQKIDDMLARYLAEEEDQDIVNMLNGTLSNSAGGQEADQDFSEEEMTFLRFSDRIKRAPRQVLRYACGGEPLWSIPFTTKSGRKRGKQKAAQSELEVPPCRCGAPRRFECQVLPSVLHVLTVDKYAKNAKSTATQLNDWYSSGGMDFGSLAVYTCSSPESCTCTEEFVVIQDTAEDQPKMPVAGLREAGDVVVDENAKFDQDDEEDDMQDD